MLNIITSFICQIVTTACGIVIPRIMIGAFGSAVYGATTSISQFLSYIALLEGGIGRVARGAMYQPLVNHDDLGVSRVYHATKRFFFYVGAAFLGYTVVISLSYRQIANASFLSWESVFFLVWAISLSTLFKYMGGLADLTLLNADQKQYYTNSVTVLTNLLNTAAIVFLACRSQNVVSVKLISSLIFILRPLFFRAFVKKKYTLPAVKKEQAVLQNKWTGIGQHIAYFLHTNTDVVILTLFADLPTVSVYAVYSLIIVNIRNITASLSGGMEAAFGALIAKKEATALHNAYRRYKMLLSSAVMVLFGVTSVLLIPFVQLYTAGITDADYSQSLFAILILVAEAIHCLTLPCSTLPISANKLKSSRWGAYGEAIVNISLSCLLVFWNPLLGVAIGTLASECFKGLYYMIYSAKHILKTKKASMIGEFLLYALVLIGFCLGGNIVLSNFEIRNYWQWCGWGIVFFMGACGIALAIDALLFPKELRRYFAALLKKQKES